jgi:hypothetical protein
MNFMVSEKNLLCADGVIGGIDLWKILPWAINAATHFHGNYQKWIQNCENGSKIKAYSRFLSLVPDGFPGLSGGSGCFLTFEPAGAGETPVPWLPVWKRKRPGQAKVACPG